MGYFLVKTQNESFAKEMNAMQTFGADDYCRDVYCVRAYNIQDAERIASTICGNAVGIEKIAEVTKQVFDSFHEYNPDLDLSEFTQMLEECFSKQH